MILDKFDLSGRTAIITGGGRGLGRGMAIAMAEAGVDVVLAARSVDQLEEAAARVRERGRRAIVAPCDVTDSAQVDAMADLAYREYGQIDILINNAGGGGAGTGKTLGELTNDDWRSGIDTNLSGVFYCSRAVVPRMAERGSGVVINIASTWGERGVRNSYMYNSAKGGVIQFTRVLAASYGGQGVRAVAILPGGIPIDDEAAERFYHGRFVPQGKLGKASDIGHLAVFLASDAAAYIQGATVACDGGAQAAGIAPVGTAPLWPKEA